MINIKHVIEDSLAQWRSISLVYLVQLLFGLIVGFQLFSILKSHLSADSFERLESGFDRTIFMDMLNNDSNALVPLTSVLLPLILIYLLLSSFMHAGLLYNVVMGNSSLAAFYEGAKRYGLQFLGYAILFLLVTGVLLLLVWMPFFALTKEPLEVFHSEKPYVLSIIALGFLSMFIFTVVWSWSICTRASYVEGGSFWASIRKGFRITSSKFLHYYGFGMLLVGVLMLLSGIFYFINADRGAASWMIVGFGILIQQIYSWIKVFFRVMGYQGVISIMK